MNVICEQNKISNTSEISYWKIGLENWLSQVDETNNLVIINYGGNFEGNWQDAENLKSFGFLIKDKNGKEINYGSFDFCRLKIPYSNLTDVSEMYFCYEDQKIKITVS